MRGAAKRCTIGNPKRGAAKRCTIGNPKRGTDTKEERPCTT